MEKMLIVDGSNLLFQMFYGMPARILNRQGRPVQGVLGFVGALLKILAMTQPDCVLVAFDGECHNPRKDLDEEYKANRPDYSMMPEEQTPFSQLPDIIKALEVLGIPWAETTDCEADDWIAGYAFCLPREMKLVIASLDSDFFQLISDNVSVLRYRGKASTFCDAACLGQKLGIAPEQYADFKSMVGDPADHIRGVRGIGPKTAAGLLRQFGTLDAMLSATDRIARPSVRQAVGANAHLLRHNRMLIRLNGQAQLPYSLAQLAYTSRGLTTTQVLNAIQLW